MSKAEDILKKYGVGNGSPSQRQQPNQANNTPGNVKQFTYDGSGSASILEKYGIGTGSRVIEDRTAKSTPAYRPRAYISRGNYGSRTLGSKPEPAVPITTPGQRLSWNNTRQRELDQLEAKKRYIDGLGPAGRAYALQTGGFDQKRYDDLKAQQALYKRGINGPSYAEDSYGRYKTELPYSRYKNSRPMPAAGDLLGQYLSLSAEERNLADGPGYVGGNGIAQTGGMPYGAMASGLSNPNGRTSLVAAGVDGSWDELSDGSDGGTNEIALYYTILEKDGQAAANQYLEDMKPILNKRAAMKEEAALNKEFAEAGPLKRAGLSAVSVPASIVGGAAQFIEDTAAGIKGEDINPYSNAGTLRRFARSVRGNQAQAWDEATGGKTFLGIGAGDVYQAGMSLADMAAGAPLGPIGYGASMGMGAAAEEAAKLYEQGASKEQVQAGAALAGAAEMIFEKVSLENLFDLPDAKTVGQIVKNTLAQGGFEASEEVFTEISNIITNAIVMRDRSDFNQLVAEHDGDVKQALIDEALNVWKAGVGGFIAGAPGGGVYSTVNSVRGRNYYKQNYGESQQDLVSAGLETQEGSKAQKMAQKNQKRLDKGKNLTGSQLWRQVYANDQQFQNEPMAEVEEVEAPAAQEAPKTETKIPSKMEPEKTPDEKRMDILSSKYKDPEAMKETYEKGDPDQAPVDFDKSYRRAHDYGLVGLDAKYLDDVEGLTPEQRQEAYAAGQKELAEQTAKKDQNAQFMAQSKTGKRGTVRSQDIPLAELQARFNDTQKTAYKYLRSFADATGLNIVLFESKVGKDGKYEGYTGKFDPSDDTIYIDINAGLTKAESVNDLAKYTMMRTFGHEYTHFIEKWNAKDYNELRKIVFTELENKGESVLDLIETKQSQTEGMTFDAASREVVAEAMTDILRDSNFAAEVKQKNPGLYESIKEKLHEFFDRLKEYFAKLGHNPSREARALQEQVGDSISYVESVIKAWDKAAAGSIVNYQSTFAEENSTQEQETAAQQEEKATEQEETATEEELEAEEAPDPITSENGFTVSHNAEHNSTEIVFDGKPPLEVREALKANKFKWHRGRKVWYGYADMQTITDALDKVYGELATAEESTAVAENATPTQEPEATVRENRKVEKPKKPNTEPVSVYRGYNASEDPKQKNLSRIRSVDDVIGRETAPEFELIPVSFFTESMDDAKGYAEFDKKLMEEFTKRARFEYKGRLIGGKATAPVNSPEAEEWIRNKAAGTFNTLYGRKPNEPGKVVRYNIYPQNSLDLSSLGNFTSVDKIYQKLSEITGISESEIDDELRLSDLNEFTDDENIPVYALLKNGKSTNLGSRFYNFMSEHGYDTFKYTEDDAAHYAIADSVFSEEAPEIEEPTISEKETVQEPEQAPATAKESLEVEEKPAESVTENRTPIPGIKPIGDGAYDVTDAFFPELAEKPQETVVEKTDVSATMESEPKKEETKNVESENGPDDGAVPQPDRSGAAAPRLLEGVEAEPVQSGGEGRGPAGDVAGSRTEDAGRDGQSDAEGTGPVSGEGDRLGGHLQQLTEEEQRQAAEDRKEELKGEVKQEIEERSRTTPKGTNFVIGDSLNLPTGEKNRIRANIEAIKLVKQLVVEDRMATPEEQVILSKYVGWGGLPNAFGKAFSNHETHRLDYAAVPGLESEFNELKELLTEEEYAAARESTKNAHYTSVEVIKGMYQGLKQMGFTGGRMLEPSSGVGNFVGAMPTDMVPSVKSWTMVELDKTTGSIAKYLYPQADVRIQGFEEMNLPDNYIDVAIGNVPFGDYAINDKHYPKQVTKAIHNYFFAKAIDKVRPGGLVMFITSSYTMNGNDTAVRQYIAQRADLLGAIRLPNTAFAGNAGTSVVTDILILKKRQPRTEYAGEAFEESIYQDVNGSYTRVNQYFVNHPEMVLGIPQVTRGMYSANELTYAPFKDRGSLQEQIVKAMSNIKGKMDYSTPATPEQSNIASAKGRKRAQKLKVENGAIKAVDENGQSMKVDVDDKTAEVIKGMVEIRDTYADLCSAMQQGMSNRTINSLRKKLNQQYDAFAAKHGYLNAPKNKKAVKQFADRYTIMSLENYDADTKKATKTDIFSKNTITPNVTVTSAENVEEGLTVSLNTSGTVDIKQISQLTGEDPESVKRQLIDQRLVFKDKEGNLIPAAQYLSGNVRAKLREMEGLVSIDKDYKNNVEALKAVVPETISYTDIFVNPGANWVPVSVYEEFVGHILERGNYKSWRSGKKDYSVEFSPATNLYDVRINDAYAKGSAQNTQIWGGSGKSFSEIFSNTLNGKKTNVYRDGPDGKRVLDRVATEAVAEKAEKINEEFRKWLWEDEARREELQETYNQVYNATVTPKYDGKSLTVNGLNAEFKLRPHQADAVARILNSGGNTLLAHRVGAGKTLEMAAAAMKLKQLGVVKKPMFVVPNNVVSQWGKEFKDYFPAANILVVGDNDMTPAERMTTINKIKNNDYDAVILAYTKFERIQMTKEWRQKFYQEQIDEILFALNAEKESMGKDSFTVKQLEKKRTQLESKIKKLTDKAKDEDGAMFEDLGVDALFVDEAHNFKNLEYTTRMNNVSGLGNSEGSQRAFDLYTKIRYLQQLNGGRGIVFATATPVMNSMTEMYIMQRYLQSDKLQELGIDNFDAWAKMFGEVVNALEIAPSGSGYRVKQTFSKFKNVKALQQLFRSFSDVLIDIPGLKIPKMKGGKVQIVECESGEFQKNYMKELAERSENVRNVDPSEDNMLKITSDGRKISYSQRMIDPSLPYEENGKIYKCCDNVARIYEETADRKGTQLIFCDMATPKGKSKSSKAEEENADEFSSVDTESAQLYDDIKARLIQLGVPENEIAFIHDAKNDKQKAALSEKVKAGKIRVLIGSTGKMGVGLNVQKKVAAIHHLDAPWRPGDIDQRDGRAFRQGNENDEVSKFVYVTKGSFDSRLWDILDRKSKFINQVMMGDDVGNEIEDTGMVTLSAAEVKAVASDNPLIVDEIKLSKEIEKLTNLQQAHESAVNKAKAKVEQDTRNIAYAETKLSNLQKDIKARKDTYSSDNAFSMTVDGRTYTDKKDAGVALLAAAKDKAVDGEYTTIGNFAGFEMKVTLTPEGMAGGLFGSQKYDFKIYPLNTTYGITHLIQTVQGLNDQEAHWQKKLAEFKKDLETQKALSTEKFDKAAELQEKRLRHQQILDELNPPEEQRMGDDEVQYQSRSYQEDSKEEERALDKEYMDAVSSGDMETAQRMVNERAEALRAEVFAETDVPTYSIRRRPSPKKTIPVYKVFTMSKTGKPSALFVSSQYDLPVGVWLDAQDTFHFTDRKNGHMYVPSTKNPNTKGGATGRATKVSDISPEDIAELEKRGYLKKGKNGQYPKTITSLAYRPGWHAGDLPFFPQGGMEIEGSNYPNAHRYNQVVFECEMIADKDYTRYHLNSEGGIKYQDMQEMPTDGSYKYSTNPMTQSNDLGAWYIGSSIKIVRALSQDEVDNILREKGRAVQEWQAFQDSEELANAKKAAKEGIEDKKLREKAAEAAQYAYEHRFGKLDLNALGYDPNATDGGKKLLDPVTYDDDGNVIPLSKRFQKDVDDIRYQQRTETLTDRDILELAADDLQSGKLSDAERGALEIFQNRLGKLSDLETKRKELGRLYREQQFGTNGKVDREEAKKTHNRMDILDAQIQRANADVLSLEDKKVLQDVLHKARKVVETKEREHGNEKLSRWRDRKKNSEAIKKYRTQIQKDVTELENWVQHPDNKNLAKHIPDGLKQVVLPFLSSIDMTSKRALRGGDPTKADAEFAKRMEAMQKALQHVETEELYSGYYDLPVDFMDKLDNLNSQIRKLIKDQPDSFVLNQMTGKELKDLAGIVKNLKKLIQEGNRLHSQGVYQHISDAADNTILDLGSMQKAPGRGAAGEALNRYLMWTQMRPAYAWERFGEGGKAIFKGLTQGQAKLAFDAKRIMKFSEDTYTDKEVKEWEKEVKTIVLDGDTVKIPVSHIMGLYELKKRPHALNHIISQAGGLRVATFRDGKQIERDTGHLLTIEDVDKITGLLTERQKIVADKLQQFMATVGGKWRNEINFIRFGEEAPIDENYYPINSDGRHLESTADQSPSNASLYALLNMSFNKPLTEGANNRIILYSIFDVFSNHMASMAQYHSMALPVLDAIKWFNYRQTVKVEQEQADGTMKWVNKTIDSVRDEMSRVYGVPEEGKPGSGNKGYAEQFVLNILKAFNGTEAQGTPLDNIGLKFLHLHNGAQIAYNMRVVMQQPLAVFRAGTIIDHKNILKAFAATPAAIKSDIEEMQKYSGIGAWKALGFYDVNISRGLTATIKQDESWREKIMDAGLIGAEKADELTWGAMWRACKLQVAQKGISPSSKGFIPAVNELFDEVIYKTQVVDSILTKNEFLRDKGFFPRAVGSFMAEPTTTASQLLDMYDKYRMDVQRGMSKSDAFKKNAPSIARGVYTYAIGAILLSAVQAVADAWRDDDEYESYPEKWQEAFGENIKDEINPMNKIPIIKDFYELAYSAYAEARGLDTYGYNPNTFWMQWANYLIKGIQILHDNIVGEDTNYTWYAGIFKLLRGASGLAGLPMAPAVREVEDIWNNVIGPIAPSLRIKSYDPGDRASIKYAFQDGYLTEEEAMEELLKPRPSEDESGERVAKPVAADENEAYWLIQKWKDKDGSYSKYDRIMEAAINGTGWNEAMQELASHGYTRKDVLSKVKSEVGESYRNGDITREKVRDILNQHFDLSGEEISSVIREWSCERDTGIPYGDIRKHFDSGDISSSKAVDMLTTYGGKKREDALETVNSWQFEKSHGWAKSEKAAAYKSGKASRSEVKKILMDGGKTEEEADIEIETYDWEKKLNVESVPAECVKDYHKYGEGLTTPELYYQGYRIRQNISGRGEEKAAKVIAEIGKLPISNQEKFNLADAFFKKNIVYKYRTWK